MFVLEYQNLLFENFQAFLKLSMLKANQLNKSYSPQCQIPKLG